MRASVGRIATVATEMPVWIVRPLKSGRFGNMGLSFGKRHPLAILR